MSATANPRCLVCGAFVAGWPEHQFCAAHRTLDDLNQWQLEMLLELAADVYCGELSDWASNPRDGMVINHSRMLRTDPPVINGVKQVVPWQGDVAQVNRLARTWLDCDWSL